MQKMRIFKANIIMERTGCSLLLLAVMVLIVLIILPFQATSQQMKAQDLIAAWKASDSSQTTKAELTYADLKHHANKQTFNLLMSELHRYTKAHADFRIDARVCMYGLLGLTRSFQRIAVINWRLS